MRKPKKRPGVNGAATRDVSGLLDSRTGLVLDQEARAPIASVAEVIALPTGAFATVEQACAARAPRENVYVDRSGPLPVFYVAERKAPGSEWVLIHAGS